MTVDSIRSSYISVCGSMNKSDLGLFKAQNHPFNEEHFWGYFMDAFQHLLSSGIHECIFIMDNTRFNKTNQVQTILHENDHRINYLSPFSRFLNTIENFLSKSKKIFSKRQLDHKPTYLI
ncbi:hypothetical protein RF11_16028 [Thelohanellus kitauei]|uniref:Tc1-like transposase DDE domain-containing protein n=1 Tax=Thelohanellus kitauei TaxID=669202 RepID=A0A0C2MHF6_THEKT|nr:hypothetical protein RF11_16028 [Thelohanellus kitauei]